MRNIHAATTSMSDRREMDARNYVIIFLGHTELHVRALRASTKYILRSTYSRTNIIRVSYEGI